MQTRPLQISFYFLVVAFLFAMSILFSCGKDGEPDAATFYGRWKSSYGDTITFVRINGKNLLTRNNSMNPALAVPAMEEYTYREGKLGIRNGLAGGDYNMFSSFEWVELGRSFRVQGIQWFVFISSTATYFTFTRIN